VQLSINALKPLDYHLDLATKLNALRRRGVMIISSGNVVHNLGRIEWDKPDAGTDWARRFDDAIARLMTEAPADILKSVEHSDYALAVPTPDHFIPLLYTAGIAAADKDAKALLRGYALGSLSMTCYGVGMSGVACEEGDGAASLPPGVPPDQTNI
jgi:4,5-DOPA dioxygenase extradiol